MILSSILHSVDPGSYQVAGMSLHLFVNRLGDFIRENRVAAGAGDVPDAPYSTELHELRDAVGHHIIPLLLIARTDSKIAPEERDIIVDHCLSVASRHGIARDGKHVDALRDYVATFRPALTQLDTAIAHLAHGNRDDVAALLDTAQKVVMSDGVSRPEEAKFLAMLRDELTSQRAQA